MAKAKENKELAEKKVEVKPKSTKKVEKETVAKAVVTETIKSSKVAKDKKPVEKAVEAPAPAKKAEAKPVAKKAVEKVETKKVEPAPAKIEEPVEEKSEMTIIEVKAKKQVKISAPVKEETQEPVRPLPNVRYSDEDLAMFKDKIQESRRDALEELQMLKERLDDLTSSDMAEESMIYSMHMAEQGSEAIEKEKTYAQITRINEYLKKLDEALARVEDKSYGICRMCGCLIAKERLLAVPATTLSASYKIQKKCPEDGVDRIEPIKR